MKWKCKKIRENLRLSVVAFKSVSIGVGPLGRGGWGMTEFEGQVLADLSVLKSQMDQLMGIGQPGRLTQLEERVERHERSVQRMKGVLGAAGGLLTVFQLAMDYFWR